MIAETDKAMYEKLATITRYGRQIPVRFFGAEKQFAKNVKWDSVHPYYCIQRYDLTFAMDGRYAPDNELIEYDYKRKIAIIKDPDLPMYLWYQIDCMCRYQRDLTDLVEHLVPVFPRDGYVEIYAYGRSHNNAFVMIDSQNFNEQDEKYVWRHAFRYRTDIRLKSLTEREAYLVLTVALRERRVADQTLIRTVEF